MKRKFSSTLAAKFFLVVLFIASLASARATIYLVTMTDSWTFSPDYLEIQINDIVGWVNRDDFDYHDSWSVDNYWYTGLLDYNQRAYVQFPVAGTFNYEDTFFYQAGMVGTIVVKPATTQNPPTPGLTDAARLPNGNFQFTVTNLVAGKTNIIQISTDLTNWSGLSTNVAASDTYLFTDTSVAAARRYYRAVALP